MRQEGKLQELVQELDWTKTDARSTLEVKLKKNGGYVWKKYWLENS